MLRIIFANYLQKPLHFSTNFYNKRLPRVLSKTESFPSNYNMLTEAMGGKTRGGRVGSTALTQQHSHNYFIKRGRPAVGEFPGGDLCNNLFCLEPGPDLLGKVFSDLI
jgi:hypothetical protein